MQLQAKWCFPPYLSSSRNSNEKRKPRKWVFILFTKAWGFEGRVQHGVQGMGTAGQRGDGGSGWAPGPLSGHSAAFSTFLYSSVFYSSSKTPAVTSSWSGPQKVTRAHAWLASPALQGPTLTWGIQGSYTQHCQII